MRNRETIRYSTALLVVTLLLAGGCHGSRERRVDTTTAATTTVPMPPGPPVVNAKTCAKVPDNAFVNVEAGTITSRSTQTGTGTLQDVQFKSGSCSLSFANNLTITVGILLQTNSSATFGKADFDRLQDATLKQLGTLDRNRIKVADLGDKAFKLKGPIHDTYVVLCANKVFTIQMVRDGRNVGGDEAAELARKALGSFCKPDGGR